MFGLILHDVHFLLHYHLTFLALISLLLIECFSQRVWGRKSLHMNLPCRSMWQKGGCIVSIRNWSVNGIPHWEQELQSLLLTLKFLLWPAACCWDSGTSPDILYAHTVKKKFHCARPVKKKCFIAEWEWAVQMGNLLPLDSVRKGERGRNSSPIM